MTLLHPKKLTHGSAWIHVQSHLKEAVGCAGILLLTFSCTGCHIKVMQGADPVAQVPGGTTGTPPITPPPSPAPSASPSPAAFTHSWPFMVGTEANYQYDHSKLDFISDAVRLVPSDQTDQAQAQFTAGTTLGTTWDNSHGYLRLANDGNCDATTTNCAELDASWAPQWNNIVDYWRMNGDWTALKGGHDGSPAGDANFTSSAKLGTQAGIFDDSGDRVAIDNTSRDFDIPASGAFSISVWAKPNLTDTDGTIVELSGGGCGACQDYALMQDSGGTGGWTFSIKSPAITSVGSDRSPTLEWQHLVATNDNSFKLLEWQHVLVTWNGGPDAANVHIYVNGKEATYLSVVSGTASRVTDAAEDLKIGNDKSASRTFDGFIDEVALWSRVLAASEALELYRRGANRIKYQVRSCANSDCSDQEALSGKGWKGPGPGTANLAYFSELHNNSIAADQSGDVLKTLPNLLFSDFSGQGLNVADNRYFQYRAFLESDDANNLCDYGAGAASCSPELMAINVDPVHYDNSAPTLTGNSGADFYSLSSLLQTPGSGGCSGGIVYNLARSNTGPWHYYKTTAPAQWTLGDGTASQANTPAELDAATLELFATQVGRGSVFFKAFLRSNGTQACVLDNLTIGGTH